jgi:exodeoxyribonuclease VII large subunit
MSRAYVFTVRELTRYVRALLAQDETLRDVAVRGEISDFVHHTSGHMYFTLKDEFSQLRCVLFRDDAVRLPFVPEDGVAVVARGTVSVYEPRGQYQLVARELERAGLGDLLLAFERLRRKLSQEGLFDDARKRPLPEFPRRIALLTSPVGAAVHDVLTTLGSRWPAADVVLIPTPVSGAGAAPGIVRSLQLLRRVEGLEAALLVRGGGSLEELSGFNSEAVARAIVAAPVPVVTGIGHETDVTIADFVADHRAPTPTGAAVAVAPDRRALLGTVEAFRRSLAERLRQRLFRFRRELGLVRARPVLAQPHLLLASYRQRLDDAWEAGRVALEEGLRSLSQCLVRAQEKLGALSPESVLARGYSVMRLPDGRIVRSARQVDAGTLAEVILGEGLADVVVQKTRMRLRRRTHA